MLAEWGITPGMAVGLAWLDVSLVGIADATGIALAWLGRARGTKGESFFAAEYQALFTVLGLALLLHPSAIKDVTAKVLVGNVIKPPKFVIKSDVFLCTLSLHRSGSVMDVTNLSLETLVIFLASCALHFH